ncbi:MAG: Carboxypeptidase regulatory-like domain [Gemmatimonadetes bacterium]|nr:Carboxypeptidase regulatory-like domain [Gemmatimonadota bacterium]
MSIRAQWMVGCAFGLAMLSAGCDNGVTNAFTNQRGTTGGGGASGDSASSVVQGQVASATGGLGGVGVLLVGRDSTQTDGTGNYRFATLPAGTYTVAVRVPFGYTLGAGQNSTQTVSVSAGGTASANWVLTQQGTTP